MARIQYGALATKINGSIGGTTFQDNKYGFTIKNKPLQPKPISKRQKKIQTAFSKMASAWSQASGDFKETMTAYATSYPQYAYNPPFLQLDGFAVFCRYYLPTFLAGGTYNPEIEFIDPIKENVIYSVVRVGNSVEFNIQEGSLTGINWIDIYLSKATSDDYRFSKLKAQYVATIPDNQYNTDVSSFYASRYWPLPDYGQAVYVKVVQRMVSCPYSWAEVAGWQILPD